VTDADFPHDSPEELRGSVNLSQMKKARVPKGRYPLIRAIQDKRLRYRRADPEEHWQSWREMMEQLQGGGRGYADCEDLAAGVVAELSRNGIKARTYVYKSGGTLYHVVVKTKRWGLLDPSIAAGMEGNG
jgi:hypothetical protein